MVLDCPTLVRLKTYCLGRYKLRKLAEKLLLHQSSAIVLDVSTVAGVDVIRDLDILFDSKLTFVPYIDAIATRSSKMLGFIIRNNKIFKNSDTKKSIYNVEV